MQSSSCVCVIDASYAWTCLYADMHPFLYGNNIWSLMRSWTLCALIGHAKVYPIVKLYCYSCICYMLITRCLRTLTHCDLQFSRNTEGAHYDVIARQLNIPMNKLKSLSPVPPSYVSAFREEFANIPLLALWQGRTTDAGWQWPRLHNNQRWLLQVYC